MQSQFENDRLTNNIATDRDMYNNYLNDIEIENENQKREQAFMRENDRNIKKLGRPTREEQRRRYDMRNPLFIDENDNQSNMKKTKQTKIKIKTNEIT